MKTLILITLLLTVTCISAWPSLSAAMPLRCDEPNISRAKLIGLTVAETPIEVYLSKKIMVNEDWRDRVYAVEVETVEPGGLADAVGLKPGDRIYRMHGSYFEKYDTKVKFHNIVRRTAKTFSIQYFQYPSGVAKSVTLPRQQPLCAHYNALAANIRDLQSGVGPASRSPWSSILASPDAKQQAIPDNPTCQLEDEQAIQDMCTTISTNLDRLRETIPDLQRLLDQATALDGRDRSPFEKERLALNNELSALLKADRWEGRADYTAYLQQFKEIEPRWQDHQARFIQWEGEFWQAVKEYEAASQQWDEELKGVNEHLAQIDIERQQLVKLAQAKKARQAQEAKQQAQQQTFDAMLAKYQATDITTDWAVGLQFYQNPFAMTGENVYFSGGYHQNITPTQAIVAILPGNPSTTYIIAAETDKNFAAGFPAVQCVGKVLGTTQVQQGLILREIPHVEVIHCLPQKSIHHGRHSSSVDLGRINETKDYLDAYKSR